MPRKYNSYYRRVYKKKSNYGNRNNKSMYKSFYRRKANQAPTVMTLFKPMQQLFPDVLRTELRNAVGVNWTGTTGAVNAYAIMGNGLHNPLSSGPISGATVITVGTATSISGLPNILSADTPPFASLAPYTNYRIIGTKIKISTVVTAGLPGTLCIWPIDGNTLGGLGNVNGLTLTECSESPYAKRCVVAGTSTNHGSVCTHNISTRTMGALRNESSLEQGEYTGTYGGNPVVQWYYVLVWFPATGNSTPATSVIDLTYEVEFFNRNALASGQA